MLWIASAPLVLASKSATRAAILRAAGLPFDSVDAQVDERAVSDGAAAADALAGDLAIAKARAISLVRPDDWVVGADQTLACDGRLFHKPASRAQAAECLRRLSGRAHRLHVGLAVFRGARMQYSHLSSATLVMRDLSDAFIDVYCDEAGDAILSSVGAYQIEGLGMHLFERVEGDHATILGLPILPLLAFFRDAGLVRA